MKQFNPRLAVMRAGLMGACAVAGVPAFAQVAAEPAPVGADTAATEGLTIEEVVVTARRKEENQQDVPLAISTLSGSFLEENAIASLAQLNGRVPALHIDNFNTPTTTNIAIRGVRSANIAPGQDSAVGLYVADVNYAYTIGVNQLLFDMQSVEILKGPQGTLFGRNSTGGAVLMTPAKPTDEQTGSLSAGATFFDGGNGYTNAGMINFPINDQLKVRAAVNFINRDGYVDNVATPANTMLNGPLGTTDFERMSDEGSGAWRVSGLWQPTDSLDSYFMYQGSELRTNGTGFSINAVNPASFAALIFNGATAPSLTDAFARRQAEQSKDFWTTEADPDTRNSVKTHAASNATTWTVNDAITVKNIVGYRHFTLGDTTDFDGLPLQVLTARLSDKGHELSEELQFQGKAGDNFNWVAGLYYSDQHINHGSDSLILAGAFYNGLGIDHSIHDNKSYAVFAQGTYAFEAVDGLSLTTGLRGTRDERSMSVQQFAADGNFCILGDGDLVNCVLKGEKSYTEPTYTVTLDYKLDKDSLIYAAHRRGYRTGGFSYVGSDNDSIGPFKPEYVVDFELGLKKDWHFGESLLRTNLAAYYQDYKDIQRFTSTPEKPANTTVVNAASAKIPGGEAELTYLPIDGLEFTGSYAVVFPQYDDFLTGSGDFSDNEFAQTPKHQFALGTKYDLPFDASVGDVNVRADYRYQSHVFYTDTEQGAAYGPYASQGQDSYGILDLAMGWNAIMSSPFDLSLYVHNVTETETKPFGVQLYQSIGTNSSTIGDPRVFGLELSYHFDS